MESDSVGDSPQSPEYGRTQSGVPVRVISPVDRHVVVRTTRTIASMFVGEGSKAEARLFDAANNSKGFVWWILWGFWYLGSCIGLAVIGDVLPSRAVWCCALMLPLPIIKFLVFSKDLCLEILHEWDFYIINFIQVAEACVAAAEIESHHGGAFFAFLMPTLFVASLSDASPQRYRPMFIKMFFVGVTFIFVTWVCVLVFLLHKPDRVWVHFSDYATLALFYIRPLVTSTMHPDHFTLIRCDMHTHKETITDADGEHFYAPSTEKKRISLARGVTRLYGATLQDKTKSMSPNSQGSEACDSPRTSQDTERAQYTARTV